MNNSVKEVEFEMNDSPCTQDAWDDYAILKAFSAALDQKKVKRSKKKSKEAVKVESDQDEAVVDEGADAIPYDSHCDESAYSKAYADAYATLYQEFQQHYDSGYGQHQQQNAASPPMENASNSFARACSAPGPVDDRPSHTSPFASPPQQQQEQQSPFGMAGPSPGPPQAPAGIDPELSHMLMAWYYSGYYTGRYQAQQEQRRASRPPFPFG